MGVSLFKKLLLSIVLLKKKWNVCEWEKRSTFELSIAWFSDNLLLGAYSDLAMMFLSKQIETNNNTKTTTHANSNTNTFIN